MPEQTNRYPQLSSPKVVFELLEALSGQAEFACETKAMKEADGHDCA